MPFVIENLHKVRTQIFETLDQDACFDNVSQDRIGELMDMIEQIIMEGGAE